MSGWVETYKGAVLASEYDAEAYMNSPIYVSRFDQATWFLLHSIGVTPAGMKRKKQRVAIVRENYQFLRELKGGELVTIRSGVVAVGKKYLRFVHQMLDGVSAKMVATCDCTAVIAGTATGKSMPLPSPIAQRAGQELLTERVPAGGSRR
ncbi:MAG TPA: thioesterase family protein [Stellaceae bacterium]|nr:thioesterase family protein [Stellaceae bacterium]